MSATPLSLDGGVASRSKTRWIRANWVIVACLTVLAVMVLAAVLAPVIAPYNPNTTSLTHIYEGPSSAHLMGTDSVGRDIFSRVLWGARTSLLGPLLVVLIASIAATAIALFAAWVGGWLDQVISGGLDVTFAFPGLLLAIVAVAIFGEGLTAPVIALGIAYTPYIARVIRGAALRERNMPYVEALTVEGISARRIAWRHLLPNLRPLLFAQCTLSFAYATIDLAALSYLGLGVQPPTADWGRMVAEGQQAVLAHHPAEALFPGVALILMILVVFVLGRQLAKDAPDVE
jgi:peptide/nickel transport system permease protein